MSWAEYLAAQDADVDTIKKELPLEWVITQHAGVPLEERGEKSAGVCPFHADTDPSLDVYADGQRWGCYPCGLDGDVLDFIGRYWGYTTFPAQMEKANELFRAFVAEGGIWERISLEETPVESPAVLREEALRSWHHYEQGDTEPLSSLLEDKYLDIDPDWLHEKWHVGVSIDHNVVAPYLTLDGEFVSYKTRYSGAGWYARKGGKLTALYGEWQLKDVKADAPIWIFEGETDTWLGSWLLGDRGCALGLPTGAGSTIRPEWIDLLRDRDITLVFDNDTAGRTAANLWHQALRGIASQLKISWPSGGDLCDTANPMKVLLSGEPVPTNPGIITLTADRAGYAAMKGDGEIGQSLTNWLFQPTKRIVNTDINGKKISQGLEGHFLDHKDKKVRVPDEVWDGGKAMLRWVKMNNRVWLGAGSRNSQGILATILAQTPFLGTERGVEIVGLHGVEDGAPVFVMPDEVIGNPIAAERWRYTPPSTGSADFSSYHLDTDKSLRGAEFQAWAQPVVRTLMAINHPSVTTMLAAWLCASVGRSLMKEFPPTGLFGESGSGKTTIAMAFMKAFWGFDEEHNLTSTTPHGVRVWAAATNGLAVPLDEFRNGAARNTLETTRQVLRDAWTASSSSRGGFGDDKQKLHESKASAPLMIIGEEALEERSHIDRIVAVSLKKSDLDPGALRAFEEALGADGGRLGRSYLEWFLRELTLDRVGLPRRVQDRAQQGEAVLEWGWELWHRFVLEIVGADVGRNALDLSGVRGERIGVTTHPLMAALDEAIALGAVEPGSGDGVPVAWVVEQGGVGALSVVAVRPRAFYMWAERAGYPLPGGERSTVSWLRGRWQVVGDGRAVWGIGGSGTRIRALQLVGVLEDLLIDGAVSVPNQGELNES